ncbi:DUF3152 domain-containing protein [Kineosporia succinea]|uniref:DUF3152 domain-containing protein n=1 Tax=Kineosporia succinea TaxID=84632 RepID=A0ABT9NYD0_9ACTN|nr:DUF3152 domain-containing protein [Kineosporia succinea]MDP9825442.1 hypothetical protein [Kineosporia succinea]
MAVGALALTGCSSGGSGSASAPAATGAAPEATSIGDRTTADPTTSASQAASSAATTTSSSTPAAGEAEGETGTTARPEGLTQNDVDAGVTSATVKWKASGTLSTVKGTARAPGEGKVYKVRVQVEKGVAVDGEKFADFVLATLNDDRSWTENGTRRFARTDQASEAFTTVTLASPETSADLCRPLKTFGKLSCRNGDRVVLTTYRWVKAIPEYKKDRDGYRHYVVNHEVGHALGHGHEYCAGKGKPAPLMMQQTKGLLGCRPNPWPHP